MQAATYLKIKPASITLPKTKKLMRNEAMHMLVTVFGIEGNKQFLTKDSPSLTRLKSIYQELQALGDVSQKVYLTALIKKLQKQSVSELAKDGIDKTSFINILRKALILPK